MSSLPEPFTSETDLTSAAQAVEVAVHAPSRPVARLYLLHARTQVLHAAAYLAKLQRWAQRRQMPGVAGQAGMVLSQANSTATVLKALARDVLSTRDFGAYKSQALYGFQGDLRALNTALRRLRKVVP